MDIERMHTIQGTISKILEAVSIAPNRVRYLVDDPTACEMLRTAKPKMSITVIDGQGTDGHPLFPDEQSFQTR